MKFIIFTKEDIYRMIACLLIGTLLGAAVVNLILGRHLDQMIYLNENLQLQLNEERGRVKQLEKTYYSTPVVRKVVLRLICDEDKHTEQELEKKIKELLTGLVGLKIDELDTVILREIINDRMIPVGKDTFVTRLETIIVDDELTFVIQINQTKDGSVDDE